MKNRFRLPGLFLGIAALFCIGCGAGKHQGEPWVKYEDKHSGLYGYKDLSGEITLNPQFTGLTNADTFRYIMAVHRPTRAGYEAFYLLKSGRIIGRDSVYQSKAASFDCESEGKIIFVDPATAKIGFFDQDGRVAVPPVYNVATRFYNGVSVALRNARKKCWAGEDENCEHWNWVGGDTILIDDKNKVLISHMGRGWERLNFYSMKVSDRPADTALYNNYRGAGNKIYSFVNYDKEFTRWFYTTWLSLSDAGKAAGTMFEEVDYLVDETGSKRAKQGSPILNKLSSLFAKRFRQAKKEQRTIEPYMQTRLYDRKAYRRFLDACGSYKSMEHPLYEVTISSADRNDKMRQESVLFVRMGDGYQVLTISLEGV
ncbi:WG repeat-containing protein [Hufsiella ginkgonis]|uniref:WG repeat-containing protein n=1 Tax=Hufsiella ginkgonis TaxID=2695274 RepID=A0A7K1Y200_9SPHI|nr:WG repeat-containing protein [Hufsiella ginkgonis]MXV17303.1 hypothetical protein [Hufsiella ginkgonis]